MEKPKSPTKSPAKPDNKAGSIRHDKSGRAIWEWAVETGRHALDSTSRLLKKLENPGLSLEETARIARTKNAPPAKEAAPSRSLAPAQSRAKDALSLAGSSGFNPYNSRGTTSRNARPSKAPAVARPFPRTVAPPPAEPSGLLSRLFGGKR